MESKKFVGIQMLEASWVFIKEQLKAIDTWFFITFISLMIGCLLAGVFFGGIAIGFIFFVRSLLNPTFAIYIYPLLIFTLAVALYLSFKVLKYCMGFLNVVALNSLDAAFGRPMRKFEQRDDRLSFIILFILVGLLTVFGFCLLIVPGIVLMVRTSMAYPIMLEEKCSPLEAINKSFDMTRGNFWPISISLFVFHILYWLPFVNIITIFVPFASWNFASLYAQLKK